MMGIHLLVVAHARFRRPRAAGTHVTGSDATKIIYSRLAKPSTVPSTVDEVIFVEVCNTELPNK